MNSFWYTEADFFDEEDDFYCFNCLGDEASLDIFIDKETLDSSYALIIYDKYVIGDKNNHVSEDVILTKGNEFLESVIGEYATLTKDQIMEMTYSASSQVTSEYNDLGTDTRTGMPWDQTEDMDWGENEKLGESRCRPGCALMEKEEKASKYTAEDRAKWVIMYLDQYDDSKSDSGIDVGRWDFFKEKAKEAEEYGLSFYITKHHQTTVKFFENVAKKMNGFFHKCVDVDEHREIYDNMETYTRVHFKPECFTDPKKNNKLCSLLRDGISRKESREPETVIESVINERIGDDFTAVWGNHLTNIARVLWNIYTEGDQFDRADNFSNSRVYGPIFSDLQYEGFIKKRRNGRKFIYSLTPFGMKQIERIKKAMDAKHIPYDEPRSNVKNEPASKENNSSTKIMPFEQCFLAELILDAEDYQGPRECCWIKPSDLNEVLRTYVTIDDEEKLNINELKEKYEKAKNKILNGETKYGCMRMRIGEDYGEIPSSCVPGLKHYLRSWPGGTRDSRTQRETTLWMCVAPSRDFFKIDDNSWNNYPVVPAKKTESFLPCGRMLKESELPVNLSNYRAKFVGTGFEPVDEIVKELGFEQGREYDLKDIALRLFDGLVNTEEWTFGAEPDDPDAEEPQIDIMVFDEEGDKIGDLFFEMTTEVDESTMNVIFDKLNDMLVNGN